MTLSRLSMVTLGIVVGIWLFCQLMRPHFFLTDDNLTAFLPYLTSMWHQAFHGGSLAVVPVGDGLRVIGNPNLAALANPLILLAGMITLTDAALWFADLMALISMAAGALGMVRLGWMMRQRLFNELPDWSLVVIATTWICSGWVFTMMASWMSYGIAIGVMPWVIISLLHGNRTAAYVIAGVAAILLATTTPQLAVTTCAFWVAAWIAFARAGSRPLLGPAVLAIAVIAIVNLTIMAAYHGVSNPRTAQAATASRVGIVHAHDLIAGLLFGHAAHDYSRDAMRVPELYCSLTGLWMIMIIIWSWAARKAHHAILPWAVVTGLLLIVTCRDGMLITACTDIPVVNLFRWPIKDIPFLMLGITMMLFCSGSWQHRCSVPVCAISMMVFLASPAFRDNGCSFDMKPLVRYLALTGMDATIAADIRSDLLPGERVVLIGEERDNQAFERMVLLRWDIRMLTYYPVADMPTVPGVVFAPGDMARAASVGDEAISAGIVSVSVKTDKGDGGWNLHVATRTRRGTQERSYWLPIQDPRISPVGL